MKRFKLTFFLAITTLCASAQKWKSDPEHSRLGFRIEHMQISEVNGIFKDFEIEVKAAKPDFSDAVIALRAEISSIDTEVEARDKHLKDKDFFDAESYSTIQFKSKSISRIDENRYSVTGMLTMHDVTKQVTMEMVHNGTINNTVTKKRTAGFQVTGTISRSDFEIGSKFPEKLIGDSVFIVADAELQLQ
ncbi:YceI family protein [Olivibacter sp. 47]|uniref:YceI family protein n=1 Tax=Olivibacter sp. 47 TaxID=3056486 RepID=UPI0025A47B7D|nr:YceI family protein [Olivibacter sp. 47]MDM8172850.1 YceI family protein [Olivibacter sp. 47]